MKPLTLEKNRHINYTASQQGWFYNLSITHLLDIMTSILAEEYAQIAKDNPEIFSIQGGQE